MNVNQVNFMILAHLIMKAHRGGFHFITVCQLLFARGSYKAQYFLCVILPLLLTLYS